jgi:hypothetical protein
MCELSQVKVKKRVPQVRAHIHRGDYRSAKEHGRAALIFDHMLKCGGSSINAWIASSGARAFSVDLRTIDDAHNRAVFHLTDTIGNIAISGHHSYGMDLFLGPRGYQCYYFTLLRNPLPRLVSHIHFMENWYGTAVKDAYDFASEHRNYMVNWLGNGSLEQAKCTLLNEYDCFGILEDPRTFSLLMQRYELDPALYEQKNVSDKTIAARKDVIASPEFETYLRQINEDDLSLYAWAKDVFHQRVLGQQVDEPEPTNYNRRSTASFSVGKGSKWRAYLLERDKQSSDKAALLSAAWRDHQPGAALQLAFLHAPTHPKRAALWYNAVKNNLLYKDAAWDACRFARLLSNAFAFYEAIGCQLLVRSDLRTHLSEIEATASEYLNRTRVSVEPPLQALHALAASTYLELRRDTKVGLQMLKELKQHIHENLLSVLEHQLMAFLGDHASRDSGVMLFCNDLYQAQALEAFLGERLADVNVRCVAGDQTLSGRAIEICGCPVVPLPELEELRDIGVDTIILFTDRVPINCYPILVGKYLDKLPIIDLFEQIPYSGPYPCIANAHPLKHDHSPEKEHLLTYPKWLLDGFLRKRLERVRSQYPNGLAILGAGRHSHRLSRCLPDDVNIQCLLDDDPEHATPVRNLQPVFPSQIENPAFDAIVLNTDCHQERLAERCHALFRGVPAIDLYAGLPVSQWGRTTARAYDTSLIRAWVTDFLAHLYSEQQCRNIAVFGAGAHTRWLHGVVDEFSQYGLNLVAIVDDNPSLHTSFWGIPVISPDDLQEIETVEAVLLSTDTLQGVFRKRCEKLFPRDTPILNMYEGLPSGPYTKEASQIGEESE